MSVQRCISPEEGHAVRGRRVGVSVVALVLAASLAGCGSPSVRSAPVVSGEDPIARGSRYVVARGSLFSPNAVFPLDFLRRRFGQEWVEPFVGRLRTANRDPSINVGLVPFMRVVDPDATYAIAPDRSPPPGLYTLEPTAWNLVLAVHCRRVPLTDEFVRRVHDRSVGPLAEVAHSAQATQWAAEQGCLDPGAERSLKQLQRERFVAELGSHDKIDSGFITGVAMAIYSGHRDVVSPATIDRLVAAQSPDGSWSDPEKPGSTDELTAFALMALLLYERPDVPPAPWVIPASG